MIEDLKDKSKAIADICSRYRVSKLEVFGSAARETDYSPGRSDIDFAVEFESMTPGMHFDAYIDLAEALEELLGRPVELVELGSAKNPYFLNSVLADKQVLYVAPVIP